MSNTKYLKPLFFLTSIAFVSASACRLDPPAVQGGTGGGSGIVCLDDQEVDAGTNDAAPTDDAAVQAPNEDGGASTNKTITPISCSASMQSPDVVEFTYAPGYNTPDSLKSQVDELFSKMNLGDKARQMRGTSFSGAAGPQFRDIERSYDTSSVRGYHYRDASRGMNLGEDIAGVKPQASFDNGKPAVLNGEKVGFATTFPVSMARGAAFDLDLEYAVGEAIGDEMQAAQETLLLAPCMNILRHPFWGRAQETYGEDSFHVGRLASAMTVGVQKHIAANAKHYLAYDIEVGRETNNAQLDEQTLREVYGRHFRMVVQDGGVASVMASYNKVNGVKSTQNAHTLTDILRTDFGFKGFVLSDWWAMPPSQTASTDTTLLKAWAVEAVHAGLDVELPWGLCYGQLEGLVNSGGLPENDLTPSVKRILEQKIRFNSDKLGGNVGLGTPRTFYKSSQISCDASHIRLAEKAALESMVLLKNDNSNLPIKSSVGSIAVVGATVAYKTTNGGTGAGSDTGGVVNFAQDVRSGDLGSSRVYSNPSKEIGPFAGICKAVGGTPMEVTAMNNSKTSGTCENAPSINVTTATNNGGDIAPALAAASAADFVVVVAGLTAQDEGEEYTQAGDRLSFALDAKQNTDKKDPHPELVGIQDKLISEVARLGKPMVVVLEGGSVIAMPWLDSVPSVVMAWYPGMVGGAALGKLLLGQANFSGKLPITWGKRVEDYDTWKGTGTTNFGYFVGYKWFEMNGTAPLYPFGHGLSYTKFEYKNLQLGCSDMSEGAVLPVVVNVANTGSVAGDEVVLVFASFPGTSARRPAKELKGFTRVHLAAGEEKQVTIPVRLSDLDYFKTDPANPTSGKWVVETGSVTISVGGSFAALPLQKTVMVKGYEH